ncbi:group I intron endonuclease family protein [Enterococcus phage VD13]|uniref:Group I intron endonuclease family protein n=1 Tax=Enterococcus phage VD13 TaxID=1458851 RepID=X2KM55_9CAUD|nr:homing endonuclease [Enterococcus phage VD13]YP_009592459.1 homing endonuclease [Enterococcus phage VD13]AHL19603.1 putative GIY-YIG domain homing endonuclease [Enterococcus phage VD13]AHN83105.1 group I intron endonuclease family protein [Enterococcus phage VD13]
MYIYLITNNINGKQYVGQTARTIEKRFNEHCRKNHQAIGKAIAKYGKENFTVEELHHTEDFEKLQELEIIEIESRNTLAPNGYNLVEGGGGTVGYNHTEETRAKMSKIKKAQYNGKSNPFYGKKHSEESKAKMSAAKKGIWINEGREVNYHTVKVINKTTGETYNSIKEAAEASGVLATHITRVCKGRRKSAGGYEWNYL